MTSGCRHKHLRKFLFLRLFANFATFSFKNVKTWTGNAYEMSPSHCFPFIPCDPSDGMCYTVIRESSRLNSSVSYQIQFPLDGIGKVDLPVMNLTASYLGRKNFFFSEEETAWLSERGGIAARECFWLPISDVGFLGFVSVLLLMAVQSKCVGLPSSSVDRMIESGSSCTWPSGGNRILVATVQS